MNSLVGRVKSGWIHLRILMRLMIGSRVKEYWLEVVGMKM